MAKFYTCFLLAWLIVGSAFGQELVEKKAARFPLNYHISFMSGRMDYKHPYREGTIGITAGRTIRAGLQVTTLGGEVYTPEFPRYGPDVRMSYGFFKSRSPYKSHFAGYAVEGMLGPINTLYVGLQFTAGYNLYNSYLPYKNPEAGFLNSTYRVKENKGGTPTASVRVALLAGSPFTANFGYRWAPVPGLYKFRTFIAGVGINVATYSRWSSSQVNLSPSESLLKKRLISTFASIGFSAAGAYGSFPFHLGISPRMGFGQSRFGFSLEYARSKYYTKDESRYNNTHHWNADKPRKVAPIYQMGALTADYYTVSSERASLRIGCGPALTRINDTRLYDGPEFFREGYYWLAPRYQVGAYGQATWRYLLDGGVGFEAFVNASSMITEMTRLGGGVRLCMNLMPRG